jgi:hypothetical protein
VRISIFTAGVLSVLAVVGIFIPSAEIYITPASKSEMITIDVSASPEHKSVELSGAVPTYVKTVVVEGRWRTPASGVTTIPRHTANGYVTFTNLTDEEISAPTGTIVSTQDDPPVRFETTRDAIIPIGPDGTDIPVLAVQPGSIGNVESGKIVAIEGALGLNLSVNNLRMTRGGSDLTSNTPVEADYQDVFAQLIDSLEETARSEFELSTDPGDIILSENPVTYQVLEESYTPEFGEPSDFLDLNLRAEFQFPYVAGTDLSELAQIVMEYQIDQDFSPLPETLQVTQVTQPVNLPSGESAWKMQASWRMEAKLNATETTSAIIGLDRDQALQQLNQNIKLEPVTEIHLIPDWWPRLPVLPFRINVINLFETETISN